VPGLVAEFARGHSPHLPCAFTCESPHGELSAACPDAEACDRARPACLRIQRKATGSHAEPIPKALISPRLAARLHVVCTDARETAETAYPRASAQLSLFASWSNADSEADASTNVRHQQAPMPQRCHSPSLCEAAPSGLDRHYLHATRPGIPSARRHVEIGLTERRRSRTDRAWGYHTAQVLKTCWATGPMPLRG